MEHDGLDDILYKRQVEPPSDDLADRILMAAARLSQDQHRSFWQRLKNAFLEGFLVPNPAMALALCLVIGVMIGTEAEFFNVLAQDDWSSFLYADEVWL